MFLAIILLNPKEKGMLLFTSFQITDDEVVNTNKMHSRSTYECGRISGGVGQEKVEGGIVLVAPFPVSLLLTRTRS